MEFSYYVNGVLAFGMDSRPPSGAKNAPKREKWTVVPRI
jgi:hypothetical protein